MENPYYENFLFYITIVLSFIISNILAGTGSQVKKKRAEFDRVKQEGPEERVPRLQKEYSLSAMSYLFILVLGWPTLYYAINFFIYHFTGGK